MMTDRSRTRRQLSRAAEHQRWAAHVEVVSFRRMAAAIYRRFDPVATPSTIAASGALWTAAALVVVGLQARLSAVAPGLSVPDVLPFYTPRDLYLLLDHYGTAGRDAFLLFTLYDVFYPFVAYGFATLVLVALLRPRLPSHPTWVALSLLPAVGLVVELLEQVGFLVVLAFFPTRVAPVAWATAALSALKLTLVLVLLLILVALLCWRAWSAVRRPTGAIS